MEEDIKWAEKSIYGVTAYGSYSHIFNDKEVQAIRNLIVRNKELEEENIHWKGKYHLLSRKIDVIPKSKVKEKIEELENQKPLYFEKQVIQGRIDLLQELLD